MTSPLTRRRFLALAGGTAGALAAGTALWSQLIDDQVQDAATSTPSSSSRRVLLVIELAGGNDGLNTLVPASGRYRSARPTVAVPEADLLALPGEDRYSLHPALAPLLPLWEAGRLAALQGIGLDDQSRSHFVATDVWRAGGRTPFTDSWLGRWLDATGGERPTPLRAVALGASSQVLLAERSLSTVVTSPRSFQLLAPPGPGVDADAVAAAFAASAAPVSADPLVAAAQVAIPATIEGVDVLARAGGGVGGGSTKAVDPTPATTLLEVAAQIIGLDVGTEVVVVGVDGFDTHANQPERHAQLLADVTTGLTRFLAAMEAQGRADDVLVITTSEFGRRVAENGSLGTDHGNGNVQFVVGPLARGGIVGELGLGALVDGDLPSTLDARSLQALALDWLGGPSDELLDTTPDRYGLL
ncbi:MAG: DUF1501 domain-containing protein [Acidimicrobiales bacterium]|nr:DUF1501 domain-containing protein [Acidimicrobiales bacterium]